MGRLRQALSSDRSTVDVDETEHNDVQVEVQPEYILKEMYSPPAATDGSPSEQELVDLVFVHGLGGNLRTTWKIEGTTEPWFTKPEFLGRLKNSVRCLSFGYNANRFGDVANTRIIHHANDLLRNLVLKRLDNPTRPIIFIAHSLGGLIVKRAILLCATNNDWSAVKDSTKSIVFMGTPHMGSEKAEDLVVVQKLASLLKFQTPVATYLTKELQTFSTAVQDINMEFTFDVHRSIELLCCYESRPQRLPNGPSEIIVPQWSAVLQGVDNIDLNCHHSGLPKFRSPEEPRFELFWGEVQRLVRKAAAPPQKLPKAPTWTDEEMTEQTPSRTRQVVRSRRRHESAQKGINPSRASIIRSSADEILKEVRNRMAAETPVQQETTVSPMKSGDFAEIIDPREFADYTRQLRTVTPENRGVDHELPHWQTCQWILTDPAFLEWKKSEEGGLLFVTGNPGCGKSNLAKFIQGVMEEPSGEDEEESLVIAFYCDSLESSRVNPPILDLVVKSLLGKQTTMSRTVSQKLRTMLEKVVPDRQKTHAVVEHDQRFNHLMEVVQTLVLDKHGIPAYLIIDGLDQCEDNFILRLLRGLDSIFRREGSRSNLKVLITSRMADSIRGFALMNSHIEMSPETVEGDIQRVVDEEVDRIITARQIATIAVTSVSAVIVERSNGSFLFAASVLKELWLIKDTGANSVFTLVTSCPSTMEAIYQHDMDHLEAERPDLFRLVQIICVAKRALRISEAREILRMQNPEITENYDLIGDLTRMCPRLVKFGGEDTLELLHQTLYDFIINTYNVNSTHEAFAEICLQYLTKLDWTEVLEFSSRYASRRNRRYQVDIRYPLIDYASPWVGYHWKNAGTAAIPKALHVWEFLCSDKGRKWQLYSMPKRTVSATVPQFPVEFPLDVSTVSPSPSVASQSDHDPEQKSHANAADCTSESDAEDDERPSSDPVLSVSSLRVGKPLADQELSPKPPLVLLAQWDAYHIIKAIFIDALVPKPHQVLHTLLGKIPYLAPRPSGRSLADFEAMINQTWDGTTAAHYAAAQAGNALEVMLPYVTDIDLADDEGATLLILAAQAGAVKGVSLLLKAGAEVNKMNQWKQSALYCALHSNSVEVVELLLKHGANPNMPADTGHSPLEVTIGKNNVEFAKVLLEYSPDVTSLMTSGQPPAFLATRLGAYDVLELLLPHINVDDVWDGERLIHNACWRGVEGVVKKLIRLGANLDDAPDGTPKATPVALVVECGHNSLLRALLVGGALTECPLPNMSAPLHIAASRGNVDACKQLLRAGCNIDAEDERQRTPLYVAMDANWPQVVELLVSHGADPSKPAYEPSLLVAADLGNFGLVQTILLARKSPNVDAKGDTGETALGIASNYGDMEILSYLLDYGADPNLRSGQRTSNRPLQLAAHSKRTDAMVELLRRGANLYPEDPKESSPFHTVCWDGTMDVIEVFLDEVDDEDELVNFEWGWYGTPLMQASLGGRLDAVEMLLSRGADPDYRLNSKINNGKSVIHAAAEGGNIKVLEAILAAAKDPSLELRDLKQRTPLYYACVEGQEEMVKYLLEKGVQSDVVLTTGENLTAGIIDGGSAAILDLVLEKHPNMDIDIPRADGKTPLFFAVTHGHERIIKTLLDRGADANRRSKNGEFPLSEAIRYRERDSLKALLEHKGTDLTQVDVFERSVLQIAQQAGRHHMPSMIMASAKTPELEAFLSENRDMFGNNASDYALVDFHRKPSWEHCINAIQKDARSLLDDFSLRGLRWERLGKFFLQLSAYSWAQIALQRSVEAVERTPLFLEHQVHCRLCLDLIPSVRYTCRTCCNTDLCQSCVGRYPKIGFRMWTCQYHTFYQVRLPGSPFELPRPWGSRHRQIIYIDHVPPRPALPPIMEGSEGSESQEEFHADKSEARLDEDREIKVEDVAAEETGLEEATSESQSTQDHVVDISASAEFELVEHESPDAAIVSERDAFFDPMPEGLRRASTDMSLEEVEMEDSHGELTERLAATTDEYTELTEKQLREFLEAVVKTFTLERTPDGLAKWAFDDETWELDYDERAMVHPGGEDADNMQDLLHPPMHLRDTAPQSDSYEFLAPLAFLFAHVPLYHVSTGLPYKTYERRAMKRKRQLQKLVAKVVRPTRRSEAEWGIDE